MGSRIVYVATNTKPSMIPVQVGESEQIIIGTLGSRDSQIEIGSGNIQCRPRAFPQLVSAFREIDEVNDVGPRRSAAEHQECRQRKSPFKY